MARIRTFVGVRLSAAISKKAVSFMRRLERTGAGYRWLETENLHITLNFIGDIKDVEVPGLCKEIQQRLPEVPLLAEGPFELTVGGAGCFPNLELPRILWLGVTEGEEQLRAANEEIAKVISERGIPKDRHAYNPHLTLGRLAKGGRWNPELLNMIERAENQEFGSFTVSEITVFSSYFDRQGPTYTPMATIRL